MISGNQDFPEGGFDGFLQSIVCKKVCVVYCKQQHIIAPYVRTLLYVASFMRYLFATPIITR